MQNPITQFRFENGSAAPPGVFSNVFGCKQLGSNGQCSHPTPQTVSLVYATGDTLRPQCVPLYAPAKPRLDA